MCMEEWLVIAEGDDRWKCPYCGTEVVDHTGEEVESHTEVCGRCGQEYEVVVC